MRGATIALLTLSASAGGAVAQAVAEEHPRVVALRFEGVRSIEEADLREVLATQATRCRSILYAPFCWVTSSHLFEERHRLDREELERDELRIRVHYFRRGWRDAMAASEVQEADGGVRVVFRVEEGAPTLVDSVAIVQTRDVLDPGQIDRVGIPRANTPLDLVALDSARVRLHGMLWDRGYADAVIHDTAFVADDSDSARLVVTIEPGRRTTIDTLQIRGNEGVSERTVRRLIDLREGQLYRRAEVLAAQRRLYGSELFRQAVMDVPAQPDSAKVLRVSLREAPFRAVEAGLGFTTTEFGQVQARFTRYNWFGGARRLDLDGAVGNLLAPQLYGRSLFGSAAPTGIGGDVDDVYLEPTWRLSAQVTQPWLFSARNSLGVAAFAHRRSVPGIVVDRGWGGTFSMTHRLADRAPVSLQYRYERTSVDAGEVYFCSNFGVCRTTMIDALSATHTLSPLSLSALAERVDDPLAPRTGWVLRLDAEHASGLSASDFRYARAAAEAAYYRPLGPGVIAARVRGGAVRALAGTARAIGLPDGTPDVLHPRKRFYAGGARSVRGYAESQLGPRILIVAPERLLEPDDTAAACTESSLAGGTCDPAFLPSSAFQPRPLGGNSLIEASVEYRVPLSETILGAVFVDAARVGTASAGFEPRSAIAPGFGIRYASPIGPIRVDLGIRPRATEELPVVTQVGEGAEAMLVQLDSPRRYDPLGEAGGFLRSLFSRLQLHLAIGEAF